MKENPISTPTIAQRAYELYLERGRQDGEPHQDCFKAARQWKPAALLREFQEAQLQERSHITSPPQESFDIFRGRYGSPETIWAAAVQGFETAQERMHEMAKQKPGRYFVFCVHTQSVLAEIDTSEIEVNSLRRKAAG